MGTVRTALLIAALALSVAAVLTPDHVLDRVLNVITAPYPFR